jgi:signal transduction histidine kinase
MQLILSNMKFFLFSFLLIVSTIARADKPKLSFNELDSLIFRSYNEKPAYAMRYSIQQLKMAIESQNDSLIYIATDRQAHILDELGMFDETLKLLYSLLKRFEKKKNNKRIGEIMYNIGSTYFQMRDHKRAYDFFIRCKNEYIKSKRYDDTVIVNFEIGLELAGLGKLNDGIELIKKNLAIARSMKNEEVIVTGLDDLSNCYMEAKDYKNAYLYQKEILQYDYCKREALLKTALYQHLAEILINLKKYDEAQWYLTEATKLATDAGSNDWLFECYKNQSTMDEAKGSYKSALYYYQKFNNTKDSVYKNNYDTKMSAMANLYELEHKQNEIENLAMDKELSATKIQRLYLIIAALILLIIIIVLVINHRKNKTEKILREKFSTQLIQTQEDERRRISKDLHDSVGQNILFIKNQIHKLLLDANPILTKSVDSVLEEVRNISKDLYPNQLEQYGLLSAIDALCEKVKESTPVFISTDLQLPEEKFLTKETKINCYRIIQECISNSLKHAAASAIRITSEFSEGKIQLIIQDNGNGFEQNILSIKANRSFGMLNIQERIRIMKGSFKLESELGKGTKSIFEIPIAV